MTLLGLFLAMPCGVHAGALKDIMDVRGAQPAASVKVPAPTYAVTSPRGGANKLFVNSSAYLSAPDGTSFVNGDYTYKGCLPDEQRAQASLDAILAGLSAAHFPVLQSRVNLGDSKCIDYTLFYTSNLPIVEFTYAGWLTDMPAAEAALQRAVANLKKAGITALLQASANSRKEGIDYTIAFAANAQVAEFEYKGYLPTPEEAAVAMAKTLASIEASNMPALQATVRTTKDGSDYLIKYLVPAPAAAPAPAATAPAQQIPADASYAKKHCGGWGYSSGGIQCPQGYSGVSRTCEHGIEKGCGTGSFTPKSGYCVEGCWDSTEALYGQRRKNSGRAK